nr:MAG TPA: hypothetical protein [Caudoviricetes sp.]
MFGNMKTNSNYKKNSFLQKEFSDCKRLFLYFKKGVKTCQKMSVLYSKHLTGYLRA